MSFREEAMFSHLNAMDDSMNIFAKLLSKRLKQDHGFDISQEYIVNVYNGNNCIDYGSEDFDEGYLEGSYCKRMKTRGKVGIMYTYCGSKLKETDEFFCSKCANLKGTKATLNSLISEELSLEDMRRQNTEERIKAAEKKKKRNPKSRLKVRNLINSSGLRDSIKNGKSMILSSFENIDGYEETNLDESTGFIYCTLGEKRYLYGIYDRDRNTIRKSLSGSEWDLIPKGYERVVICDDVFNSDIVVNTEPSVNISGHIDEGIYIP